MLKAVSVLYHALPAWSDEPQNAVDLPAVGVPVPTFERDARTKEIKRDADGNPLVVPDVLDLAVFDPTRGQTLYLKGVKLGDGIGEYSA